MKKKFKLSNLDCANCAAKMEDGIRKLDGVIDISVSFMTQRMIIETEDDRFHPTMEQVVKICKKIEPDMSIMM